MACLAVMLAGCESGRFGGRGATAAAPRAQPDPVITALPSGTVTSEPLPPPPGAAVPTMPGGPGPVETVAAPPPDVPGPNSRSAAVGSWTAREATGASCRVTLSSTSSLDLYRASAGGCANKDLAKITAWDFRDGEVYLYQPGGAVAARLRAASGGLSGVLAKSGAPLTLTRS